MHTNSRFLKFEPYHHQSNPRIPLLSRMAIQRKTPRSRQTRERQAETQATADEVFSPSQD